MNRLRAFGILSGLLLAMIFMAAGAYAHGPIQHGSSGTQAGITGSDVTDKSQRGALTQVAWITAADHALASSDCSGEIDGECCSQHCCVGATVAISTAAPTLAMELPLAENPPEAPGDLTLSGLLRPPCR